MSHRSTLVILLGVLVTGPVAAQQSRSDPPGVTRSAPHKVGVRKQQRARSSLPTPLLELLRSRPLTLEESRLLAHALARLDLTKLPNRGGKVGAGATVAKKTSQELTRLRDQVQGATRVAPPATDAAPAIPVSVFQETDRDRDGSVTLLEFRDRFQASVQLFLKLDGDRNGHLDATEFQAAFPTDHSTPNSQSPE